MSKKALVSFLAAAVLAVPAVALADHGGRGGGGHGGKTDTYQLKGTLSAYTAAVGTTPGSITIHVLKGNRAGRPFVGMTLTFVLTTATRIEPRRAVIVDGDHGSVQVKAAARPRCNRSAGGDAEEGRGRVRRRLEERAAGPEWRLRSRPLRLPRSPRPAGRRAPNRSRCPSSPPRRRAPGRARRRAPGARFRLPCRRRAPRSRQR